MSPLLLLAAACADAPPAWPEGARVQVSTHQLLYDAPATTEEELRRRSGRYGFSLGLPLPVDDGEVVEIRVYRGGRLVGSVPVDGAGLRYDGEAQGAARWAFEAVDDAGQVSPRLEAATEHIDPFAASQGGQVLGIMSGSTSAEDLDDLLGGLVGHAPPPDEPPAKQVALTLSVLSAEGALSVEEATGALRRREATLVYCAEKVLREQPVPDGQAVFDIALSATGRATVTPVAQDHLGVGALTECFQQKIMRWRVPMADSDTAVTVQVAVQISD